MVELRSNEPPRLDAYLDGRIIPNLKAIVYPETISLILDHRFAVLIHSKDLELYVTFIANALAVGAGYRTFREYSEAEQRVPSGLHIRDNIVLC